MVAGQSQVIRRTDQHHNVEVRVDLKDLSYAAQGKSWPLSVWSGEHFSSVVLIYLQMFTLLFSTRCIDCSQVWYTTTCPSLPPRRSSGRLSSRFVSRQSYWRHRTLPFQISWPKFPVNSSIVRFCHFISRYPFI